MHPVIETASIFLTLCLSIPFQEERDRCPPSPPPPEGPIWISTELPMGNSPPLSDDEEVAALIRARLKGDDGPVLPESEIHGRVVDETGMGVRSQVFLKSAPRSCEVLLTGTWTDDEGRFTLTGLPAGWFIVWTVKPGEARLALNLAQVREHRATRGVRLLLQPICAEPAGPM